ncbi:MAG: hypothetical protein P4L77_10965 [Sulfuriferula sp.]|nr:hypothetical protein [Sulfuriferula sp.]
MSASIRLLAERATGQYPVSIATSLALEAGMGIHPEIESKTVRFTEYNEFWVNLRTVYRNMMGAMEGDAPMLVLGQYVAEEMQREMDRIQDIVSGAMKGRVVFYVSNYKDVEKKYPNARIRVDNTQKQKIFRKTQTDAISHLLFLDKPPEHLKQEARIQVFDLALKPKVQLKTLILTHVPYDLLSAKHFGSLDLLESHTGHIKSRAQWYTKYYNGKELLKIPFREDLLQVFGDNELFHPYPIEQRRELLEVANKYNWSSLTTTEKIRYGIDMIKNPYFVAKLRAMMVQ